MAKFDPGQVVATPPALKALEGAKESASELINRHLRGDWGSMGEEDCKQNDASVNGEGRLHSSYELSNGETLWIITEWDRSVTTLLLPEDY